MFFFQHKAVRCFDVVIVLTLLEIFRLFFYEKKKKFKKIIRIFVVFVFFAEFLFSTLTSNKNLNFSEELINFDFFIAFSK